MLLKICFSNDGFLRIDLIAFCATIPSPTPAAKPGNHTARPAAIA
jgi:hypothetical protein